MLLGMITGSMRSARRTLNRAADTRCAAPVGRPLAFQRAFDSGA